MVLFCVWVCVYVWLQAVGALQKCLDRWRVGEKLEDSWKWKFKFFISTPTHTDRYKLRFLVQKICARYLVEVYHEGTKPDRNRLPALHAGENPIHQTNLCLLCWHVWANQSHKHDQTHLPKWNQTAVHKLDIMAGRRMLWCKPREMGHIGPEVIITSYKRNKLVFLRDFSWPSHLFKVDALARWVWASDDLDSAMWVWALERVGHKHRGA